MLSSEIIQPTAIMTPFAVNGDKNIPNQTASGTETSSINNGFLPITSEPLEDGGIAPERIDFNGMFYLATDQRVFLQNGGIITYDENVAQKIGGYPQGAILGYVDSNGNYSFLRSTTDNNQYNFITNPEYIGQYWVYAPLINTIETLKLIYPIGAIYIGTTATCPLSALFGTWTLVSQDRVLQGASSKYPVKTQITAGLPNLFGWFIAWTNSRGGTDRADNLLFKYISRSTNSATHNSGEQYASRFNFNASGYNSTYGNSTTVQPPAYAVNIWERTA